MTVYEGLEEDKRTCVDEDVLAWNMGWTEWVIGTVCVDTSLGQKS